MIRVILSGKIRKMYHLFQLPAWMPTAQCPVTLVSGDKYMQPMSDSRKGIEIQIATYTLDYISDWSK